VSEVTEALEALVRGERTLDEVEQFFRTRQWPRRSPGQDTGRRAEGSFTEVADSYSRQDITLDQYLILAEAASSAMKKQHRQAMNPTTDEQVNHDHPAT
jgi:hypothetical protein